MWSNPFYRNKIGTTLTHTEMTGIERKRMKTFYWITILSALYVTILSVPSMAGDLTFSVLSEPAISIPRDETMDGVVFVAPSESFNPPGTATSSPPPWVSIPIRQDERPVQIALADVPPESSNSEEPVESVADPFEPVNRVFFYINDKLYFWVLKPVASGYKTIIPEDGRVGVRNFFSNLTTPIRLVNCLLQAKFKGAGNEVGRFLLNTTFGLAGFLDLAKRDFNVEKQEADFGQTLGIWGIGPAFYMNWPILGPSNLRDTVGFVGDLFLDPRTYVFTRPIFYLVRPVELVNETSLTIGDYERFKISAIDPYIAMKDAYQQYRQNKIRK
jgi:phospholipid-binding lipoprotein MlaA